MVNQLTNSIEKTFAKSIQLLKEICESEIEKIFLLKIIDHILKRPDRYRFGFIFEDTDTEIINGVEVITSKTNYQLPDGFGCLSGLKIDILIQKTQLEIFPQKKIEFYNPDNVLQTIKYRLDFGIYKYSVDKPNENIKNYCIECDGFDFHNTKNQLLKDNHRARNLLLKNGFTTIRYLGTEVYNLADSDVGRLLFNL